MQWLAFVFSSNLCVCVCVTTVEEKHHFPYDRNKMGPAHNWARHVIKKEEEEWAKKKGEKSE